MRRIRHMPWTFFPVSTVVVQLTFVVSHRRRDRFTIEPISVTHLTRPSQICAYNRMCVSLFFFWHRQQQVNAARDIGFFSLFHFVCEYHAFTRKSPLNGDFRIQRPTSIINAQPNPSDTLNTRINDNAPGKTYTLIGTRVCVWKKAYSSSSCIKCENPLKT